ncbi:hypothetical protein MGU_08078 [Metarhizium guizhouense ARSEF 977]|uniref:Uncharacterized protein n=1 Tax=Metarhizium guizhouense (strain ARSEF 977) TaxID=1276136 RepID=A0A0B4GQ46_METGA|nr:hypothetical protein MGU_08078 [Metarhizium guizhouense ARSEF 977]
MRLTHVLALATAFGGAIASTVSQDKGLLAEPKELEERTEDKNPYGYGNPPPVQHTQSTTMQQVQPTYDAPAYHTPSAETHFSKPTPTFQTPVYSILTTLQTSAKPVTSKPSTTQPATTYAAHDTSPVYGAPPAVTKSSTTQPAPTYGSYSVL